MTVPHDDPVGGCDGHEIACPQADIHYQRLGEYSRIFAELDIIIDKDHCMGWR